MEEYCIVQINEMLPIVVSDFYSAHRIPLIIKLTLSLLESLLNRIVPGIVPVAVCFSIIYNYNICKITIFAQLCKFENGLKESHEYRGMKYKIDRNTRTIEIMRISCNMLEDIA